jgi:hypothetical protein
MGDTNEKSETRTGSATSVSINGGAEVHRGYMSRQIAGGKFTSHSYLNPFNVTASLLTVRTMRVHRMSL